MGLIISHLGPFRGTIPTGFRLTPQVTSQRIWSFCSCPVTPRDACRGVLCLTALKLNTHLCPARAVLTPKDIPSLSLVSSKTAQGHLIQKTWGSLFRLPLVFLSSTHVLSEGHNLPVLPISPPLAPGPTGGPCAEMSLPSLWGDTVSGSCYVWCQVKANMAQPLTNVC